MLTVILRPRKAPPAVPPCARWPWRAVRPALGTAGVHATACRVAVGVLLKIRGIRRACLPRSVAVGQIAGSVAPPPRELSATSQCIIVSLRVVAKVLLLHAARRSVAVIVRPARIQATDTTARRCGAAPFPKDTDGVRFEHRRTPPAGDVGGPLQLQRRGNPTVAGAASTARHQAAGAAADRHRVECSVHANPRRGGSRSELGAVSLAKANSFRAAEAHVRSARSGHVGLDVVAPRMPRRSTPCSGRIAPSTIPLGLVRRVDIQEPAAPLASVANSLGPTSGFTKSPFVLDRAAVVSSLPVVTFGAASIVLRPMLSQAADAAAWRCGAAPLPKGTDGVRFEHRQASPAGDVGGPLQLQRRGSPTVAGATSTARHQAAGAAADRHSVECSVHTNPRRGGSRSELGAVSLAKANSFRAAKAHVRSAQDGRVGLVVVVPTAPRRAPCLGGSPAPTNLQRLSHATDVLQARATLPQIIGPAADPHSSSAARYLPLPGLGAARQRGVIVLHRRRVVLQMVTLGSRFGPPRGVAEEQHGDESELGEASSAGGARHCRRRSLGPGASPLSVGIVRGAVRLFPARPLVSAVAVTVAGGQAPLAPSPRPRVPPLSWVSSAPAADDPCFPGDDGSPFATATTATPPFASVPGATSGIGPLARNNGPRIFSFIVAMFKARLRSGLPPGPTPSRAESGDADRSQEDQEEDRPTLILRLAAVAELPQDAPARSRSLIASAPVSRIKMAARLLGDTASGSSTAAAASVVGS